jgi:LPS sulfotransferase NodH
MYNPIKDILKQHGVDLSPIDVTDAKSRFVASGIHRPYIIVMPGRCGSTWLSTAINSFGKYGNPIEYFSEEGLLNYWSPQCDQSVVDVLLSISKNFSVGGFFGFKINPKRLEWINELIDLSAVFTADYAAWIDMRRFNFVKQSLSFLRAQKTGVWHVFDSDKTPSSEMQPISDREIWDQIIMILEQEEYIESFYKRSEIRPLRVWYEEIFDSEKTLVLRTINYIDPSFKPDSDVHVGKTKRLNTLEYDNVELRFVSRYAELINKIACERGNIDMQQLKRSVFEKVAQYEP